MSNTTMTITIGTITFDHVDYDADDDDVLYLSVGEPRGPADSYGTPEGHNVRYDDQGNIIALTLVNAKWLLERIERGQTNPTTTTLPALLTPLGARLSVIHEQRLAA
jgi:uncharacterized protein YuzE